MHSYTHAWAYTTHIHTPNNKINRKMYIFSKEVYYPKLSISVSSSLPSADLLLISCSKVLVSCMSNILCFCHTTFLRFLWKHHLCGFFPALLIWDSVSFLFPLVNPTQPSRSDTTPSRKPCMIFSTCHNHSFCFMQSWGNCALCLLIAESLSHKPRLVSSCPQKGTL